MAEQGCVPKGNVIYVLENALSHEISFAHDGANKILFVKYGNPEVMILPEDVTRRLLGRISAKYGVRIEWFYHPEMIAKKTEGKSS